MRTAIRATLGHLNMGSLNLPYTPSVPRVTFPAVSLARGGTRFVASIPKLSLVTSSSGASSKEKKELRAHAGRLGKKLCIHQIGKQGITPNFMQALGDALTANELVKVKIGGSCDMELDEVVEEVEQELEAEMVGKIGNTFLLFRPRATGSKLKPMLANLPPPGPSGRSD
eukprot:CAMPEP_0198211422 /NCGR_PEP_ID=MMETSP1445-20131203/23805_1 /TAXON_ID=36898 /ORGANISM="Pyramimonas sp., Strain CCMP2087" /LENGTH=169 /DNA_ID=CAMNT_0043885681 /DNA_START=88 /DNA_END=597 /DNA_ORIENTATION=-